MINPMAPFRGLPHTPGYAGGLDWDSKHLKLFLETLKVILHDIYVVPDEKKNRTQNVQALLHKVRDKQKQAKANNEPEVPSK